MRILSIDPGLICGWALVDVDDDKNVKVLGYGEIPILGTGLDALLTSVWGWLGKMLADRNEEALGFDLLVFEGPLNIYGSMTQTELHEVRGVIRAWAALHQIPHADYHPMAVKKAVTGSSKAKKLDVAAAVRAFFDLPRLPTDHVSDALAIALTHLGGIDGPDSGLRPDRAQAAAEAVAARAKPAAPSNRATRRAASRTGTRAPATERVPTKAGKRGK